MPSIRIASSECWEMVAHHLVGLWTWFCEGDHAPSERASCSSFSNWVINAGISSTAKIQPTTCIRQAIICFTQLLLLLAFYVFLASFPNVLPGALFGSELLQTFETGSILYNVTAVLSGMVGVSFVGGSIWVTVTGDKASRHDWMSLVVQGVAWITIAISLRIRLQNPAKQVAYVWWILTFLLATLTMFLATLDLLTQATGFSVEIVVVIASWPVSILLLACAISGERWIMVEVPDEVTEPLIDAGTG